MGLLDSIRSIFSKGEETDNETGEVEETEDFEELEPDSSPARGEAELVVTGTMKIAGVGTVVTVRITGGSLETGDTIRFEDGSTAEIETMELHHRKVERAEEGNVVGLELEGIDASGLSEGTEATSTTETE